MNCIVCDSNDYEVLFKAGKAQKQQILKCKNCGLMYANNTKGVSDIKNLESAGKGVEITKQYMEKQQIQINDYKEIDREIVSRIGRRASILEIGANIGILLNYFKRKGYSVCGIEPNVWCANFARKKFGLNVYASDLIAAKFNRESFDVVVMLHVIEHLQNPNVELEEIYRVLKDGGYLVVETPSFDSLSFKLLRHRERSIRCRGHLFFFTPSTLKLLLEKNGFQVKKLEYVGRTLSLERLLHNLGIVSGSARLKARVDHIAEKLGFAKYKVKINIRDMQRVYAMKVRNLVL